LVACFGDLAGICDIGGHCKNLAVDLGSGISDIRFGAGTDGDACSLRGEGLCGGVFAPVN
jgi:hypothetical protein